MIGPFRSLRSERERAKATSRLWKSSGGISKVFKTKPEHFHCCTLACGQRWYAWWRWPWRSRAQPQEGSDRNHQGAHGWVNRIWKIVMAAVAIEILVTTNMRQSPLREKGWGFFLLLKWTRTAKGSSITQLTVSSALVSLFKVFPDMLGWQSKLVCSFSGHGLTYPWTNGVSAHYNCHSCLSQRREGTALRGGGKSLLQKILFVFHPSIYPSMTDHRWRELSE